MSKKYILLDTNVLIDYYVNNDHKIVKLIDFLIENAKKNKVQLLISNICIAEVFKVLAQEHYLKENKNCPIDKYWDIKQRFSDHVTRSFKYGRFQQFHQFDLKSLHIVNADLIFRPAMLFAKSNYPKIHISTIDLLLLAQGIELSFLFTDHKFCILTSDGFIYDLAKHLKTQKNGIVSKSECIYKSQQESGNTEYLGDFNYPCVYNANDKNILATVASILGSK